MHFPPHGQLLLVGETDNCKDVSVQLKRHTINVHMSLSHIISLDAYFGTVSDFKLGHNHMIR